MSRNHRTSLIGGIAISFLTIYIIYYSIFISSIRLFTSDWWIVGVVIPIPIFVLLHFVISSPFMPFTMALTSQYLDARLRGFWKDQDLDKQILDAYASCSDIKIKVTRAYDLFVSPENRNFYLCTNDADKLKKEVKIKLLMHPPCMKSKHIKSRAEAHHKNIEYFVTTWFDVLQRLLVEINTNESVGLTLKIRFYSSEHDRWRFYIFGGKKEALFVNYYDDQSSGNDTPMYKVLRSHESLLTYFDRYFNEIWDGKNDSMDAREFMVDHFAQTNNPLTQCVECEHRAKCARIRSENLRRLDIYPPTHEPDSATPQLKVSRQSGPFLQITSPRSDEKKSVTTQPGISSDLFQNQQQAMNNYENAVFVSYAWESESERAVDELERAFAERNIRIIRDKKDLVYKGSIEAFEQRIGQGQCVVLVVSDRYLCSEHCMCELVEVDKNQSLRERIFPIVLADARIYKAKDRLIYIKHWDKQIEQLNQAIKKVNVMTNLAGITTDLDKYARIRSNLDHLTDLLSDMNALTPEKYAANGFSTLVSSVERAMAGKGQI